MIVVGAVLLGLLIGLTLGAVGGGGSVLTVPALVYLLGVEPKQATVASLVVVGTSAAVASVGHLRAGHVRLRTGVLLAVTGIPASLLGARWGERLPPHALLLAFAALMIVAAGAMLLRPPTPHALPADEAPSAEGPCDLTRPDLTRPDLTRPDGADPAVGSIRTTEGTALAVRPDRTATRQLVAAAAAGLGVGLLTGLLGVGGGFVVVPVLVVLLGLPMADAVGTSLLVIALNSGVAFVGRFGSDVPWHVVLPFTVGAVVASLLGSRLAARVRSETLTRSFAVLLLLVAAAVVAESTGLIG